LRLATITMSAVAALGAGGCLTWSRPRSVVVRQLLRVRLDEHTATFVMSALCAVNMGTTLSA
jgi:hypothetical protein